MNTKFGSPYYHGCADCYFNREYNPRYLTDKNNPKAVAERAIRGGEWDSKLKRYMRYVVYDLTEEELAEYYQGYKDQTVSDVYQDYPSDFKKGKELEKVFSFVANIIWWGVLAGVVIWFVTK
jgi:hypothetical protein